MIETWLQWTCDGCGETGNTALPNETRVKLRADLLAYGWRFYGGDLAYCKKCVERGIAARRETDMSA